MESWVEQDILAWADTQCGVLLVDPHGSLYERLIGWCAANDLSHIPLVPFDLSDPGWIVSYNPLRKREGQDPSVLVANFVRAICHLSGWDGTQR